MSKPTILICSTAYLPHVGGAEVAVAEVTRRLAGSFRFVLLTARLSLSLPTRERVGEVEVYRVGFGLPLLDKLLLAFFGRWYAVRALKGAPVSAVWAIMASFGGLAALQYAEAYPKTRLILTLQEGDSFEHIHKRARLVRSRFQRIFARADAVTAISRYLAHFAEEMGARVPAVVIPNGVDLTLFQFRPVHLKEGRVRLVTTSRLVKKNAVDDCIRALAHLPKHITLTIAGDGVERSHLESLATQVGVRERVQFLGTLVPSDVPSLLAHADIFVRPSLSEGLGNSFLEAFAAGVPVIATPVGGIPDFLRDGETGWFAEVRNPESIAACVRYILDSAHREQVARVTVAARTLVEREYTWDSVSGRIGELL